jgi:hypothetical protein
MEVPEGFEIIDDLVVDDGVQDVEATSAAPPGRSEPSQLFRFNNFRISIKPGQLGTTADYLLVDPRSNEHLGAMRRLPKRRLEVRDWDERIAFAIVDDHGYEITTDNGRFIGYTDANLGSILGGFSIRTRSGKTWITIQPEGKERYRVMHITLGEIGEFLILRRSVKARATGSGDDQLRTMIARVSRSGQNAPCGHEAVLSASLLLAMGQFTHDEWKSNLY